MCFKEGAVNPDTLTALNENKKINRQKIETHGLFSQKSLFCTADNSLKLYEC